MQRRPRPKLFRVFWIVVTLMMLTGAGILALGTGLLAHGDEETMGFVIGMISCGLWSVFAMLKSTRYKRIGFWNETLRPLLALMFVNGAAAIAMVIGFMNPNDEELFGLLAGMIPCGLFGLVCLFAGRKPRYDIDVSGLPRPRSKFATIGSMLLALTVSIALTGAAMMLFGGRRTVHFPTSRSYVIGSDMGRELAARAYSEAVVEEALRVPGVVHALPAPSPPSMLRIWKPIKGLKGAQSSWEQVGKDKFVVHVRSEDCLGDVALMLRAVSRDGKAEEEKLNVEICGDEQKLGPYFLEHIPSLHDVELKFVHAR